MSAIDCDCDTLTSTCGVSLFMEFGGPFSPLCTKSVVLGGADLACAGFIDTPNCRMAYEQLKARFNIVYQSTPRRNSNSGRQFFFVVYDGRR